MSRRNGMSVGLRNASQVAFPGAPQNEFYDLLAFGPKIKTLEIAADFDNTEQDTGWALPASCVVLDVYLLVTTADAAQTLDVGTSGSGSDDPDGFLDGVSVAATGVIKGAFAQTTGSSNNYVGAAATHTRGALLTELLIAGADVTNGGDGVAVAGHDVSSGGDNISYTGSDTTNTMRGHIVVVYIDLDDKG